MIDIVADEDQRPQHTELVTFAFLVGRSGSVLSNGGFRVPLVQHHKIDERFHEAALAASAAVAAHHAHRWH